MSATSEIMSRVSSATERLFQAGRETLAGEGGISRFVRESFGVPGLRTESLPRAAASLPRAAEPVPTGAVEELRRFQDAIVVRDGKGAFDHANRSEGTRLSAELRRSLNYGVDTDTAYPTVDGFRRGTSFLDKLKAGGAESASRNGLGVYLHHEGDSLFTSAGSLDTALSRYSRLTGIRQESGLSYSIHEYAGETDLRFNPSTDLRDVAETAIITAKTGPRVGAHVDGAYARSISSSSQIPDVVRSLQLNNPNRFAKASEAV